MKSQKTKKKPIDTRQALALLVAVLEAHDVESLSCDRDGHHYCDCLADAIEQAKATLSHDS